VESYQVRPQARDSSGTGFGDGYGCVPWQVAFFGTLDQIFSLYFFFSFLSSCVSIRVLMTFSPLGLIHRCKCGKEALSCSASINAGLLNITSHVKRYLKCYSLCNFDSNVFRFKTYTQSACQPYSILISRSDATVPSRLPSLFFHPPYFGPLFPQTLTIPVWWALVR
jgi:hypothetical protein